MLFKTSFCNNVKNLLPLNDISNIKQKGYLSPYEFVEKLSKILTGFIKLFLYLVTPHVHIPKTVTFVLNL
jgi:hypothetical protein